MFPAVFSIMVFGVLLMAPDPDRDRLRPAHILESMAISVSALFYSFLVAKLIQLL